MNKKLNSNKNSNSKKVLDKNRCTDLLTVKLAQKLCIKPILKLLIF